MFPAIGATFLLRLAASAVGAALQVDLAERARAGGDVTATTLALLSAAFYTVELVGAPILGARADRVGYRALMLAGPVAGGLAALLLNLPGHVVVWLLARGGQGVSTAASVPATLSYVSAATAGNTVRRGRAMAFFEVATAVGLAAGLPLGLRLWAGLGRVTYLALAGLYILALVGFFFVPRTRATEAPHDPATAPTWRERLALLRQPRVITFAPAWLAVNATVGVWMTHGIFQLSRRAHPEQYLMSSLPPGRIGLVLAIYGALFLIGLVAWGWLVPRVGVERTLWIALSGMALATLSLLAINHLDDPLRTIGVVLLIIGVLIQSGFVPAALVRLADISEESHPDEPRPGSQRGLVMGTYSLVLGLGQLLGGAVAAPFAQRAGVDGLIAVTAGLVLVAGGSLLLNLQSRDQVPLGATSGE